MKEVILSILISTLSFFGFHKNNVDTSQRSLENKVSNVHTLKTKVLPIIAAVGVVGTAIAVNTISVKAAPLSIDDFIKGKPAAEKASLKGIEIAKLNSVPRTKRANYDIEITQIKSTNSGVELLARAWDANGQIGFGEDGSVDLERFRIANPPILVDDPLGEIVRTWEVPIENNKFQVIGWETKTRRLRLDPKEALLQSLEHTIKVKQEKFGSSNIVAGKIGNTTTTAYPNANPESTSVDGRSRANFGGSTAWATIQGDDGTNADADDTSASIASTVATGGVCGIRSGDAGGWNRLSRSAYYFDASADIPDTDTVNSATVSVFGLAGSGADLAGIECTVYTATLASDTAVTAADFDQFGTVAQSNTTKSITGWSTEAYNDYALNATGIGNVSKTGVTKFALRFVNDASGSEPAGRANDTDYAVGGYYADEATTAKDPKLVVEHGTSADVTFPGDIWSTILMML